MRVAAATALGAAAVKAKMMADAEEREVQRQVQIAIEAQLQKVQLKLNSMTQLEDALERERSIMEVCLPELLLIMHSLFAKRRLTLLSEKVRLEWAVTDSSVFT